MATAPDTEAEPVLRSRGVVLARDHERNRERHGTFAAPPEVEAADKAAYPEVTMSIGAIAEMGNPERITVLIHAGDHLAEPE